MKFLVPALLSGMLIIAAYAADDMTPSGVQPGAPPGSIQSVSPPNALQPSPVPNASFQGVGPVPLPPPLPVEEPQASTAAAAVEVSTGVFVSSGPRVFFVPLP